MKEQQHKGAEAGRNNRYGKLASGKLPEARNGETNRARDAAAAATGVSPRTYAKIDVVAKAAKEEPELCGPIAEEMDRTGNVDRAYKQVKEITNPPPAPVQARYPHDTTIKVWLDLGEGLCLQRAPSC